MKKSLLILTSLLLTVSLPLFASCGKTDDGVKSIPDESDTVETDTDAAGEVDTSSEETDANLEAEEDIPGMVHVGVSIYNYDENNNCVYDVLTVPAQSTAAYCFQKECELHDIPIVGLEDGFVTSIGERENKGNEAWIYSINGTVAMDGVNDYYIVPDDDLTFTYQDWTTLFE